MKALNICNIVGLCVCRKNSGALDCSIDLTQPPIVHAGLGDEYCDVAEDHCDEISIHGENFIMNPTLTCKVEGKEVTKFYLSYYKNSRQINAQL